MFDYWGRDRRRLRRGTRAFSRELDLGGARLFVDHGFQWDGSNNVWLTRARATYVLGSGPVFDIRPRAFLLRVTGFYGGGTPSGDPCFDDFFTVRTADPDHTYGALTTRARSLLAGCFEDARLISDGHMVTLWREGESGLEADADAAVEVVSEIVHYRSSILAKLERLPGAQVEAAHGFWDERSTMHVTLHLPCDVHIGPLADARGPVMASWAHCGRAQTSFRIAVDDCGQIHGDGDRLPEFAKMASDDSTGLGPCEISCDGSRVTFRFRQLEVARRRLFEAARLVASLCGNSRGTYR